MPVGPARDIALDRALADVRRRHRQVQGITRRSVRALREAQRVRAVIRAELLAFDHCDAISADLTERPDFSDWFDAMTDCAVTWPGDRKLQRDLRSVRWAAGPHPTLDELRVEVTEAAIEHNNIIEATRSKGRGRRREPVPDEERSNLSRQVKKEVRREAERNLHATLSSLSVAVTAVLNAESDELRTVASGSLRRR